ncbi:MAG TPA: SLC13 family permease [Dehalococcoidia bacterium]|nr:SLC13 family permease [Dehalococcoidia bacterium]
MDIGWYSLFTPAVSKWFVLGVVVSVFGLVLYRKVNITYVALIGAGLLVFAGVTRPQEALFDYINWDVLAIYWGYGMLAHTIMESRLASWVALQALGHFKKEKYALLFLCVFAALLSSVMANPVVVLILAPVALEIADRLKTSPFLYVIALAISSNVVTTVTMVADPPALILALETGMRFLDFYWFHSRPGLGTITLLGVATAMLFLLWQFRRLDNTVAVEEEPVRVTTLWPLWIFLASVVVLSLPGVPPGGVGLAVGVAALVVGQGYRSVMVRQYDWMSILFLAGIFVIVATVEQVGILQELTDWLGSTGFNNPTLYLILFVWLSVLLSSFIDNVPFTVLMIPVCTLVAQNLGVSPFPFYFGMLIGTGMGGNITPVGATANVLACGILERRGYKIQLQRYMAISVPFTIAAVLPTHLLLQWLWL